MRGGRHILNCEKQIRHTSTPASAAGKNSSPIERKANTAQSRVLPQLGERRTEMTEELRNRIIQYRTAMSIIKGMLREGIIDEEDYRQMDSIIAEKCGLKSTTIFR